MTNVDELKIELHQFEDVLKKLNSKISAATKVEILDYIHELEGKIYRLEGDVWFYAKQTLKYMERESPGFYKELLEYVRYLEKHHEESDRTIQELREDLKSEFDKRAFQLKFQHSNYEVRIKKLELKIAELKNNKIIIDADQTISTKH